MQLSAPIANRFAPLPIPHPADLLAVAIFVLAWCGYAIVVKRAQVDGVGLMASMHRHRLTWMRQMAVRENRIVDTSIMSSLQNGTAFFASTSLIAIGGAATLLRAGDDALRLFSDLPFIPSISRALWEVKALGLLVIFGYAFFKFAWAYRLFNYSAILIGATPPPSVGEPDARLAAADRAARMAITAGSNFAAGQRAFFFSFAYLGWFLGPYILLAATLLITVVIWRRQFRSEALEALAPVANDAHVLGGGDA